MSKLIKRFIHIISNISISQEYIIVFILLKNSKSWVERQVKIEKIYFDYSGLVIVEKLKVLNSNQNYYDNLLKVEKIVFNIDLKSIFSDLIIVKSLNIKNPEFFLDINYNKILKKIKKMLLMIILG